MEGSEFRKKKKSKGELQQGGVCLFRDRSTAEGSGVSGKQSGGKWTGKLYFPTRVPSLWIKVSVGHLCYADFR